MPTPLPCGSWPTPITSDLVVRAAARLGEVCVDGVDVWWSEGRPAEGGRSAVVRRTGTGTVDDVLPPPWNARTRVHEYGGGAWTVADGVLWFTEFADQRLHRLTPGDAEPRAVTPAPDAPAGVRFADLQVTPDGSVLAVRETHPAGGGPAAVVNEVVRIDGDGTATLLVSGPDFVSDPRQGPDGALCWLQWQHPDMPWDAAQLVVRSVDGAESVVAGGPGESAVQPRWAADGTLWFLCDRTDAWSLYRWRPGGDAELVFDAGSDIALPQWVFGQSRYALLADGRIALAYPRDGADRLAVLEPGGAPRELDLPYAAYAQVRAQGTSVVCVAGGPDAEPVVLRIPADGGAADVLRPARDLGLDPAWFSRPEPVTFPTPDRGTGVAEAHALVYPPANPDAGVPDGERPPLLVVVHGGPTGATSAVLNLGIQYWTSRGFCVADVDYRGSTGYGRRYREALKGGWGVVDLDDVEACVRFLVDARRVDPARLAIRGGSAGGYTTLAALTMRPGTFTAGASHYGLADLSAFVGDTHKFESRYLDGLVAPWPSGRAVYEERSPINHVDALDTPLAVFQGEEDAVVPPAQAELIVAALRAKGVPHAYLLFSGEQHGFRRAENIRAALDGELSFYAQVWRFDLPPGEGITPIQVVGVDSSR
ncbi:prolyl oligopeptidase family serine peptidase [Geodermatophilus sp. YIM 151500]|uniref:prolyl oligopeptidase family serine peptidase n=1 Tax=Geodermatophilus sp. YIM 151500 TaxID=2984531 RepID=UPI0021E4EE65|nr:prolyl oligopeptidase family serine peptidase [Geodermatophilus sp. YIM 151500]MCV2488434.1 prolyl oligopeptidase family serine peptidase [Geodermatophilus sp. YIM 151500]